jgi:hypothetical protein
MEQVRLGGEKPTRNKAHILKIEVGLCRPTSIFHEVFWLRNNSRDPMERAFAHGQMISQQPVVRIDRSASSNHSERRLATFLSRDMTRCCRISRARPTGAAGKGVLHVDEVVS